jgi:hypothetical protein
MRENGGAQLLIRQLCQHRGLHRRHDLSRLGADHREAESEVVISTDKSLHEALCFVRCLCAQYRGHR